MTLAVIATMGVYALQMASTEVKTAGFVRQQMQTQYLSMYAMTASAQALGGTNAQLYNTLMMQSPDTGCYSLYGVPTTANSQSRACHRAGSYELATEVIVGAATPPTLVAPWVSTNGTDVQRGSLGTQTFPDFFVEVTDPNQRQPPPGYATTSGLCFIQFTASAMGITPTIATTSGADTFSGTAAYGYLSENLAVSRGHILGGPVTCSGTN